MRIGGYEATECQKPVVPPIGVRHIQTEHGPADIFVDRHDGQMYMRVWLNREGIDEVVWFLLTKKGSVV